MSEESFRSVDRRRDDYAVIIYRSGMINSTKLEESQDNLRF